MKKLLKVLMILVLVFVVLTSAGAAYIYWGPSPVYEAQKVELTVEATPERIAHGQKLVASICQECHAGDEGTALTGKLLRDMHMFGKIYTANITQDEETGIGKYTDGELYYAIRTGIRPDGSFLIPPMPKFAHMADEDVYSIIAFLRSDHPSVNAVNKQEPEHEVNFLARALVKFAFKPLNYPTEPIVMPDGSDKVELGRYLVTARYDCWQCHSEDFATINMQEPEKSPNYMGGGNVMGTWDGGLIATPNITMHQNGIAHYNLEQFGNAVRFGKSADNKPLIYPMPKFATLSDEEIKAMWAYIQTIPQIDKKIMQPES